MKRLDNIFKKHLEEKAYEPSSSSWADVSKRLQEEGLMSEAVATDKKKRKRRFLFLLFFIGIGILGLVGYGSFNATSKSSDSIPLTSNQEISNSDNNDKKANNKSQITKLTNNPQITKNEDTVSQNNAIEQRNRKASAQTVRSEVRTPIVKEASLLTEKKKLDSGVPNANEDMSNTGSNESINTQTSISIPIALAGEISPSESGKGLTSDDNEEAATSAPVSEDTVTSNNQDLQDSNTNADSEVINRYITPLTHEWKLLPMLHRTFDLSLGDAAEEVIVVHHLKKNSLGIALGGITDGQMMGTEVGLVYRKRWTDDWSTNIGMAYIWNRSTTYKPPVIEQATVYGFGSRSIDIQMQPTSLHFLSLPVCVTRSFNRFGLRAGMSLDYLLGMYGRIETIDSETGIMAEPATFLNTRGLYSMTLRPELGMSFDFSQRNTISLLSSYRIPGLTKSSEVIPLGHRYALTLKFEHYVF